MKDKEIIMQAVSTNVSNHFDDIKDKLLKNLKYKDSKEQSISLLNNISIFFTNSRLNKYQACAIYDNLEFEDREQIHQVNWELSRATSYAKTLIHEISHLIISDYPRILNYNGSGHHCLEFAIVTYCIEHKLYEDGDRQKCYFNSYDIHEDKAYSIVLINPCSFDTLIKNIEWETFDDLVSQAEKLARRIRLTCVKRNGQ